MLANLMYLLGSLLWRGGYLCQLIGTVPLHFVVQVPVHGAFLHQLVFQRSLFILEPLLGGALDGLG